MYSTDVKYQRSARGTRGNESALVSSEAEVVPSDGCISNTRLYVVVLPSAPTSTMLAGIDIAFGKKMLVSSTGTPAHQVR
jgi:hypothetical protein